MRKTIRGAVIYFVLALGCILGAGYIADRVWHDTLLIIGGLLLGGLAAMMTLIEIRLKARKTSKEGLEEHTTE